eukprot:CAMPEP_0181128610 /NCGR_PEP_ID=MMETSP1071-20121207/28864_1 /TAXON_ID=35127 /ORGANISM="Thalassiosira sp., Strain NH16" /LENGTH=596 /DNA_ID=CAMNT_0023214509 /DNA_START=236 /DNA_END=2026 /DNA_ORIENTATION=+
MVHAHSDQAMNDKKKEAAAAKKARKEARRAIRRELAAESTSSSAAHDNLGLPPTATVELAASKSNAHRPLPAPPQHDSSGADNNTTICLFYQYKEPSWTAKEHKAALNGVIRLATEHRITGRGRCAPEGLNCTLTASANDMRAFCYALRSWDPDLFDGTDFKLEDGVSSDKRFRTFTLRKVDELVGYALDGIRAPSLNRHSGTHLEAPDYHRQMQRKDTVIIDVRNAYESDIGRFAPPKDGATLLDPKMRTSQDFPKWLNAPETKEQLKNKTVMMYCTGGIRCERATALLNQITDAEPDFKTKGVVMVRGGIERYLKTFPEGGYWKGKNYLFDKRMEQAPANKSAEELEKDVVSYCCLCRQTYSRYRGQFKCGKPLPSTGLACAVPVIVCDRMECQEAATSEPHRLECPLCVRGYQTPETAPDLIGQKRKLGLIGQGGTDVVTGRKAGKLTSIVGTGSSQCPIPPNAPRRLFVGKLPLTITATKLRKSFLQCSNVRVQNIHWITDHTTHAFYGSAFCYLKSTDDAQKAVQALVDGRNLPLCQEYRRKGGGKGRRKQRRMACVAFASPSGGEDTEDVSLIQSMESPCEGEYPPMGTL